MLLNSIADQNCTFGKACFPGGVLWMEMCRCKEEFLVARRKLGHNARDGGNSQVAASVITLITPRDAHAS